MHIFYTACGESAKEDVLLSVKALWLFASLSLARGDHYYHVHVLTDGAMHPDDLSFLQPLSHFKASTHPLFPKAANVFRPCASERLYVHEHADFKHLDKVMPPLKPFLWHSVSACGCYGAPTVHVSSARPPLEQSVCMSTRTFSSCRGAAPPWRAEMPADASLVRFAALADEGHCSAMWLMHNGSECVLQRPCSISSTATHIWNVK